MAIAVTYVPGWMPPQYRDQYGSLFGLDGRAWGSSSPTSPSAAGWDNTTPYDQITSVPNNPDVPLPPPYGVSGATQPPPPTGGPGVSTAPVTKINLSWLLPFTTALAAIPVVGDWLAGIADGAIIAFDALPGPVQDGLIALFALVGVAVVKGIGVTIFNDLTHHTTGSAGTPGVVPAGWAPAWKANGVQFYRSANGRRFGVMNKRGRFKTWTPPKPIVIFKSGVMDLRTFLKAEKVLKKQAQELNRAIDRHMAPRASRTAPKAITDAQAVHLIEAAAKRG